jgi:hypothetical protein
MGGQEKKEKAGPQKGGEKLIIKYSYDCRLRHYTTLTDSFLCYLETL